MDDVSTVTGARVRPSAEALSEWLRAAVSELTGTPLSAIGLDEDFDRFGLDSASAVAIVVDLEEQAQLPTELDPEIIFEKRTIRQLSDHVAALA